MTRKVGQLFAQFVDFSNLYRAWVKARQGTGWNTETRQFCFQLERELLSLQTELETGDYKPQDFRFFTIRDPKHRIISVAPFRDRVVHHALVQILMPIFEPSFIYDSYATRVDKGTHKAIVRAQGFVRRYQWYYKLDIEQFFATIQHDVMISAISHKIKDKRLLQMIEAIIRHPQLAQGLPIGNLTSQFFANIYLNQMDHLIKEQFQVKGYLRYMDDFVLFSDDKGLLKQQVEELEVYIENELKQRIKPSARCLNRSHQGLSFLGMRIFPSLLRHCPANRQRSLQRIKSKLEAYERGFITEQQMTDSIQCSWAHLHYFAS